MSKRYPGLATELVRGFTSPTFADSSLIVEFGILGRQILPEQRKDRSQVRATIFSGSARGVRFGLETRWPTRTPFQSPAGFDVSAARSLRLLRLEGSRRAFSQSSYRLARSLLFWWPLVCSIRNKRLRRAVRTEELLGICAVLWNCASLLTFTLFEGCGDRARKSKTGSAARDVVSVFEKSQQHISQASIRQQQLGFGVALWNSQSVGHRLPPAVIPRVFRQLNPRILLPNWAVLRGVHSHELLPGHRLICQHVLETARGAGDTRPHFWISLVSSPVGSHVSLLPAHFHAGEIGFPQIFLLVTLEHGEQQFRPLRDKARPDSRTALLSTGLHGIRVPDISPFCIPISSVLVLHRFLFATTLQVHLALPSSGLQHDSSGSAQTLPAMSATMSQGTRAAMARRAYQFPRYHISRQSIAGEHGVQSRCSKPRSQGPSLSGPTTNRPRRISAEDRAIGCSGTHRTFTLRGRVSRCLSEAMVRR
jgi:hypothetical protein